MSKTKIVQLLGGLPQSDWSQTDETAVDYIKNKPFYTGTPEEVIVLPETTITDIRFAINTPMVANKEYTITLNEVQYICTSNLIFDSIITGNVTLMEYDGIDTGEPFCLRCYPGETYVYIVGIDLETSPTLSIATIDEKICKIDEKYLPEIELPAGANVGQITSDHGEIFNDYDNNVADYRSHAEGKGTTASGYCSHAEGESTTTSGYCSHAEGYDTTASGDYSHAEGYLTTASGIGSHAEGNYDWDFKDENGNYIYNTASGSGSHAEGNGTTASGSGSHAEGNGTTASGVGSHAEGKGTTASGDYSHVQGKYNINDAESKYAHIVGNGASKYYRSNAHTIDWNGLGWFAGGLKVGGTGQDDGAAVDVALKTDILSLDTTLSVEGSAADAKAVGDIIVSKQDSITGTEGQFVVIGADGKPTVKTIPSAEGVNF